jgi:hypothetical protein
VTLSVALAVLLAGTRPLAAGLSVDLGEPDSHALARQTTVLGFGLPRDNGRTTLARTARLIWNRPLPGSFMLEIEAAGCAVRPPFQPRCSTPACGVSPSASNAATWRNASP